MQYNSTQNPVIFFALQKISDMMKLHNVEKHKFE